MTDPFEARRLMIEPDKRDISIVKQCDLLGISRSGYYYSPRPESPENLKIMRMMDEQYLKTPFYGARRMHAHIKYQGYLVNIKRIRRLLHLMGLEAIYPKPNISKPLSGHKIYPYLLNGLSINNINIDFCKIACYEKVVNKCTVCYCKIKIFSEILLDKFLLTCEIISKRG